MVDTPATVARRITTVTVIDPDSDGPVDVDIYKHANGGLFGIDASYLAAGSPRVVDADDDDADALVPDLFDEDGHGFVRLVEEEGCGGGAAINRPDAHVGSTEPPDGSATSGSVASGRVYGYPCTTGTGTRSSSLCALARRSR